MTPEMFVPLLVSNAFALVLAVLCWRRPRAGQLLGALLFLGGGCFNLYHAFAAPHVYETFRAFAWLDAYRQVIDAIWPTYATPFIAAIALGQIAVGVLLAAGGRAARLGALGASVFLAAITPLGWGAAFPFTLVAIAGFAPMLRGPAAADRPPARPRHRHP